MNNTSIYGGVLESTPAPELIANGSIVPPKVNTHECDILRTKQNAPMVDCMNIMGILDSCLLYTSPSPRDRQKSRMPSSA